MSEKLTDAQKDIIMWKDSLRRMVASTSQLLKENETILKDDWRAKHIKNMCIIAQGVLDDLSPEPNALRALKEYLEDLKNELHYRVKLLKEGTFVESFAHAIMTSLTEHKRARDLYTKYKKLASQQ